MSMKIDQPTIFNDSQEIDEAVKCGYLSMACGYATHGSSPSDTCNNQSFPTMFWKSGYGTEDTLSHQPNDKGLWLTDYADTYNRSVQWKNIRANYVFEGSVVIQAPMTPERNVRMSEGIKNHGTYRISGSLNGQTVIIEMMSEEDFAKRER